MNDARVTAFGSMRSVIPANARFSPDGRWVCYNQSDGVIGSIIYVEPFPATGARYQLDVQGPDTIAHKAVWSPDGRELFYVPRFAGFESVTITTHPTFAFGRAVPVPRDFIPGAPSVRALFDITPDGRFIAVRPEGYTGDIFSAPQIQVVLNWLEELKQRVPTP